MIFRLATFQFFCILEEAFFFKEEAIRLLVLTRKPNQSIVIGDEIEITVVEVKGEQVRLGINAPKHISVHRREVYEAIKGGREKKIALQSSTG